MMKSIHLFILVMTFTWGQAQVADFENFNLSSESFLNGSDGNGGFSDDFIFLPNDYNDAWMSWSGWAISNTTDTDTPGFMNQYSAITGGGANASSTYAVAFVLGESIMKFNDLSTDNTVYGLWITNSTYAYLSMRDGDAFAKKFGGDSGDDPDYFLLTVKGYKDGALLSDSVDFYLADYRFEDNTQDYIVDEWTWLDLSSLGDTDSLSFALTSTDVGQFGMNTPAYFCIDEVRNAPLVATEELNATLRFELLPNPASASVRIQGLSERGALCSIYDLQGRMLSQNRVAAGEALTLTGLASGTYIVKVKTMEGAGAQLLVVE
ncbi:MAG TPA: DUF4465 domain-containing protein [Phaeodactylibacter sp.]|nr:DUF4465 domain-containing protein [Phaeodactylibacter sp.]